MLEQLIMDLISGCDMDKLSNTDRALSPTRPDKASLRKRLADIKLCK